MSSEIVFADDDPAMREMVGDLLRAAGYRPRLIADASIALGEIRRLLPDLVILDYRMGPPNGMTICRGIKSDPWLEHLPVLILTGEGGVEDRIQGFDAGANDYLAKPFDSRELLARIRALLRLTRQGRDLNPTSGLPGGEAIQREIERRDSLGVPFAVTYFDLDYFKPFGDRFGFALGDRVIQEVGQILIRAAGEDAFVGHVGGDDFLVVSSPWGVRERASSVRAAFAERLGALLPREVTQAGRYSGIDRDGRRRDFPLTRLAAAIAHVFPGAAGSLDELGERVAQIKLEAKREGSGGIAEVEIRE